MKRLLCVPGLKLNKMDLQGWTALSYAVNRDRTDVVSLLRFEVPSALNWSPSIEDTDWTENGLPPPQPDYPLVVALRNSYAQTLSILLTVPHLDLCVTDDEGSNVAQIAVEALSLSVHQEDNQPQRCLEMLVDILEKRNKI